ncbi:nuclear transport factor 2 family protein [Limnohabitans parvus]|uniref:nuclear transport factor 2 family protein n=1 Tax=Limnohabitans parvus TaxID=540061 RepID=UPI00142D9933|nr:nuclear transport factor 2 family protein [Limnohabitans parvus]
MDTLALLQAENRCRHLVIAAAEAVDGQQYEVFAACFTEDAVLQRPGGEPLTGRAAILASYAQKSPHRLTQHLLCNHRVVVDPAGWAESSCKVLLYVSDQRREHGTQGRLADSKHHVGEFRDHLILTPDGWRIQNRKAWFELQVD